MALEVSDIIPIYVKDRKTLGQIKTLGNAGGELVVVEVPGEPCANDDGGGRCGHPEHAHTVHGCMEENPACWCDEYVSPRHDVR